MHELDVEQAIRSPPSLTQRPDPGEFPEEKVERDANQEEVPVPGLDQDAMRRLLWTNKFSLKWTPEPKNKKPKPLKRKHFRKKFVRIGEASHPGMLRCSRGLYYEGTVARQYMSDEEFNNSGGWRGQQVPAPIPGGAAASSSAATNDASIVTSLLPSCCDMTMIWGNSCQFSTYCDKCKGDIGKYSCIALS